MQKNILGIAAILSQIIVSNLKVLLTAPRAASELSSKDPKSTLYLHDSYHVTENISLYLLFVRAANIHSYFLQLNHVSHSCAIDMLMCNISLVPIPMTQQRWTT